MKILMVCLGNICRSPLAEGILKAKVESSRLDWEIDSAGTGAWHVGESPDERSVAVAKKYGLDISNQRARKFRSDDLKIFDLIFVMDSSNYNNVKALAGTEEEIDKIALIMNMVKPGYNQNVPDPYYNNGFEKVYQMLDEACDKVIEKYRNI